MDRPHQKIWNEIASEYHNLSVTSLPHLGKNRIVANLISELRPKTVLNLGCGSGVLEEMLCKIGFTGRITSVDGSGEMLKIARSRQTINVNFIQKDLNTTSLFSIVSNDQDVVVMENVLFLLDDKEKKLQEVKSVLCENGEVILVEPKPKGNLFFFVIFHLFGRKEKKVKNDITKKSAVTKFRNYLNMAKASNKIDKMERDGYFKYNEIKALKELLQRVGFREIVVSDIQAKQNWLIQAKK